MKALSDYTTNFCFGKGVTWTVPKENEAVIPPVLDRIWHVDNDEARVLWEAGQNGSVTGDVFLKVAYEDAWRDPAGNFHKGRVRILPLNPSLCFVEWHPHDRERMLRFKLKYRFFGTTLEGTRSVFTYVELITAEAVEEYINDELISSHANTLGEIPIVHIPNTLASSSPWGMPDIADILSLNRQYNETATQLADTISYHSSPTTVIVGAKASQLEAGANKVWAGLPKDAQVYNLEMSSDAPLAQAFLDRLKQAMHEMTGVPVTALGQQQAVSNTSGVALQIQYQPMMQRFQQKALLYGKGYAKVNEYALKTLALKEPEVFAYDPSIAPPLKEGQLPILDRRDPTSYLTHAKFHSPLPIDKLIKLNEIMSMMQLGLESKRGALKELGVDNPDEKLAELLAELVQDAKEQGSLDLIRAEIQDVISFLTFSGAAAAGGVPGGDNSGGNVASAGGPNVSTATGSSGSSGSTANTQPQPLPGTGVNPDEDMLQELSTLAQGTKLPQRRMPDNNNED